MHPPRPISLGFRCITGVQAKSRHNSGDKAKGPRFGKDASRERG